jgi:hypothetical protein
MTRTYNVFSLSEAVSPITHNSGTSGNESLVMRSPVVTPNGIAWVPSLSGNALRHRLVREPGGRWLIERYGLRAKLTLAQLNYLFHGGNLTEGGGREDLKRIAEMQRLFPLFRLLGGSLPDQILSGSMLAWPGMLVCEENRACLAAFMPDGWELPSETLRSAESFVSGVQYTRGEAGKTHADLVSPEDATEDAKGKSNLMIFAGQAVIRGACFIHGFTLQHVSRLELGALLLSLSLWQEAGGTIGGASARGHGRLKTRLHCPDSDGCIAEYIDHADKSKDEAMAWLTRAFAKREDKPKRGKKDKAVAIAEPSPRASSEAEGLFP